MSLTHVRADGASISGWSSLCGLDRPNSSVSIAMVKLMVLPGFGFTAAVVFCPVCLVRVQ